MSTEASSFGLSRLDTEKASPWAKICDTEILRSGSSYERRYLNTSSSFSSTASTYLISNSRSSGPALLSHSETCPLEASDSALSLASTDLMERDSTFGDSSEDEDGGVSCDSDPQFFYSDEEFLYDEEQEVDRFEDGSVVAHVAPLHMPTPTTSSHQIPAGANRAISPAAYGNFTLTTRPSPPRLSSSVSANSVSTFPASRPLVTSVSYSVDSPPSDRSKTLMESTGALYGADARGDSVGSSEATSSASCTSSDACSRGSSQGSRTGFRLDLTALTSSKPIARVVSHPDFSAVAVADTAGDSAIFKSTSTSAVNPPFNNPPLASSATAPGPLGPTHGRKTSSSAPTPIFAQLQASLSRRLLDRPSVDSLVQHNILFGHELSPSLTAAARAFKWRRNSDGLNHRLARRASRESLIQNNIIILEEASQRQQCFKKKQNELATTLGRRSSLESLIQRNIFNPADVSPSSSSASSSLTSPSSQPTYHS